MMLLGTIFHLKEFLTDTNSYFSMSISSMVGIIQFQVPNTWLIQAIQCTVLCWLILPQHRLASKPCQTTTGRLKGTLGYIFKIVLFHILSCSIRPFCPGTSITVFFIYIYWKVLILKRINGSVSFKKLWNSRDFGGKGKDWRERRGTGKWRGKGRSARKDEKDGGGKIPYLLSITGTERHNRAKIQSPCWG